MKQKGIVYHFTDEENLFNPGNPVLPNSQKKKDLVSALERVGFTLDGSQTEIRRAGKLVGYINPVDVFVFESCPELDSLIKDYDTLNPRGD